MQGGALRRIPTGALDGAPDGSGAAPAAAERYDDALLATAIREAELEQALQVGAFPPRPPPHLIPIFL
eukprot:scaffold13610_cov56-Isochrysis_galbana.AAC.1